MMKSAAVALLAGAGLAASIGAEEVAEPRSGTTFPSRVGDKSLLGLGLRTKTFLKVKVYAIGLYVADSALSGPLGAHRGRTDSPGFFEALVQGDFPKRITMKFLRDLSSSQIQEAMRDALGGADRTRVDTFVGYFPAVRSGEECVLEWAPGGTLDTTMAGAPRPPIADRAFASAVFAIWLGEKPVQDDLKKALVSRAKELVR
ncbi:MAG TPA: chalcone isomerase family protein [Vicinamibacteria bacterium]|nr:chalcone isomerase family protein [Vicinamibacteria bacterium]